MKLTNWLKQQGISQAEFARQIEIDEAILSKCLSGERVFSLDAVNKIYKLTDIVIDNRVTKNIKQNKEVVREIVK